jgi:anthranilate 1,2-dioxygenase small subunit
MSEITPEVMAQLDALQLEYMDALGRKDMDAWLATFDAEGAYVCKTLEAEERGLGIAFILDDCHDRLKDRVQFVTRVWAGTFQDYQPRHFAQRVSCQAVGEDLIEMRSNFSVMFTRSDTQKTEVFAAGQYVDLITLGKEKPLFRSKTAITDAPLMAHYMAYPI